MESTSDLLQEWRSIIMLLSLLTSMNNSGRSNFPMVRSAVKECGNGSDSLRKRNMLNALSALLVLNGEVVTCVAHSLEVKSQEKGSPHLTFSDADERFSEITVVANPRHKPMDKHFKPNLGICTLVDSGVSHLPCIKRGDWANILTIP
jgi:hypothetical protein